MKLGELLKAKGQMIGTSKQLSPSRHMKVTVIRNNNSGGHREFVWVGQRLQLSKQAHENR
jgi:hypothetical protein